MNAVVYPVFSESCQKTIVYFCTALRCPVKVLEAMAFAFLPMVGLKHENRYPWFRLLEIQAREKVPGVEIHTNHILRGYQMRIYFPTCCAVHQHMLCITQYDGFPCLSITRHVGAAYLKQGGALGYRDVAVIDTLMQHFFVHLRNGQVIT